MDPLTHLATGVICSQLLPAPSRWWAAAAGAIFAVLPDVDYFFIFWDRLAFIRYHRGFTHSLAGPAPLGPGRGAPGPGPGRPPLVQAPVHPGAGGPGLAPAPGPGHLLRHPAAQPLFPAAFFPGLDFYHRPLFYRPAAGRGHRRPGLAPLGAPGGSRVSGRGRVYLLVCASYHHQALDLARRVFQDGKPGAQTVAALPQPFSCRRWQLIAAGPAEIRQAFVQLPFEAALGLKPEAGKAAVVAVTRSENCPAPAIPYQAPGHLTIQIWTPAPAAATVYSPEAEAILATFLEFARFPLLCQAESQGGEQLLEWRDLRFSIPGRGIPFVLQLRLDAQGRLQHWLIGHRG